MPTQFDEVCIENGVDLDDVRDVVSRTIAQHNLRLSSGVLLDATFRAFSNSSFSVMTLKYGAAVDINVSPPSKRVHVVQVPLRGSASVASGRDEVLSTCDRASVPDPVLGARMSWSADCEQLIVRLDADVLERRLQSMIGCSVTEPIHFGLSMDLHNPECRTWLNTVQLLLSDVRAPAGIMNHPLLAPQIESVLFTGLLLAQPHNYSAMLADERTSTTPRKVRDVIQEIEENPHLPLTVEGLAARSGTSARALQKSFQKAVGCSPMAYLREIRLQRAHDDLAGADPRAGVTVTDTALRWGFMHLGRFSVSYRERFGEPPSTTLRR